MSFFKVSKDKKDLAQSGNSKYINKSGAYAVNLIAPFVNVSQNGSTTVDLFVDYEGQKQPIYGNMRITNNNGATNEIGTKVFNQLAVIAGVEDISEPTEVELPLGKAGADKEVEILEDLANIDVVVVVRKEYSAYNKNIQERNVIRAFYRADDYASAEEIVNDANHGEQFKKEEKYLDNITYKDGLDEEAIQQWINEGRPKGTAGGVSSTGTKKAPSFGKSKPFGQK